jgi:putative membrane protein
MLASRRAFYALFALVFAIFLWSAVAPRDRFVWLLDASPAILGMLIVAATYRRFPLTLLLYALLALAAIMMLVGAHYTFTDMPLFNLLRDTFGLSRNHYDRVGHVVQGVIGAMAVRECLIRTSPLRNRIWLFLIPVMMSLGFSAGYEIIEWLVAVSLHAVPEAFLGLQGDIWDTQEDMMMALLGAVGATLCLARLHDKALRTR